MVNRRNSSTNILGLKIRRNNSGFILLCWLSLNHVNALFVLRGSRCNAQLYWTVCSSSRVTLIHSCYYSLVF